MHRYFGIIWNISEKLDFLEKLDFFGNIGFSFGDNRNFLEKNGIFWKKWNILKILEYVEKIGICWKNWIFLEKFWIPNVENYIFLSFSGLVKRTHFYLRFEPLFGHQWLSTIRRFRRSQQFKKPVARWRNFGGSCQKDFLVQRTLPFLQISLWRLQENFFELTQQWETYSWILLCNSKRYFGAR